MQGQEDVEPAARALLLVKNIAGRIAVLNPVKWPYFVLKRALYYREFAERIRREGEQVPPLLYEKGGAIQPEEVEPWPVPQNR